MQRILLTIAMVVFLTFPVSAEVVGDINQDGTVGLEEAIYALQTVAGMQTTALAADPVSFYVQLTSEATSFVLCTVPPDKKLVITDVRWTEAGSSTAYFHLKQEVDGIEAVKTYGVLGDLGELDQQMSFNTGIVFDPGATAIVECVLSDGVCRSALTLSGYFINN